MRVTEFIFGFSLTISTAAALASSILPIRPSVPASFKIDKPNAGMARQRLPEQAQRLVHVAEHEMTLAQAGVDKRFARADPKRFLVHWDAQFRLAAQLALRRIVRPLVQVRRRVWLAHA